MFIAVTPNRRSTSGSCLVARAADLGPLRGVGGPVHLQLGPGRADRGRRVGRGEALDGARDVLRHPRQQPHRPRGRLGQPRQVLGDAQGRR